MKNTKLKTKHVSAVLLTVFILTMLPILLLGFYDYPCADDYSYSSATRQVWLQSHSALQVFKEAAATSASRYQTWQGTFTSIFFMALQPAVWTEKAYFITPFLMTGLLTLSVFYLVHVVVVRYLGGTAPESTILSLLILLTVIQCMVDKTDAFYWYNGSVHYMVPFSFLLLMLAALLSALACERKKHMIILLSFSSLCAVLVGGGNYVSGLVACVLGVSLVILLFFLQKQRMPNSSGQPYVTLKGKGWKAACIPVLFLLVSFLVNTAAPGNRIREETVQGMSPFKSIMVSFRYTLSFAVDEWSDWTVWALVLFSLPFLWKIVKNSTFRFPCPPLVAAYSYCIVSSAFTPAVYATGNIDAGRIRNIIFILYVLLLFLNAGYILGWACHSFHLNGNEKELREILTVNQRWYVLFASFALIFGIGITVKPNPGYYTTSAAFTELVSGEAKAYGAEMDARIEILRLSGEEVILPRIQTQPELLYHSDITPEADDWSNAAMSRYYGKKSITIPADSN